MMLDTGIVMVAAVLAFRQTIEDKYIAGRLLDIGWPLSSILIGLS